MKRKVLFFVVLALTAVMVWAGGGRDSQPAVGGVIEISAVLNLNPEIVLENNPVIQMLEKDLNIRLKIEAPPMTAFTDRVKILVSTGEQPDLVHYGADIFATQWAQEGLLLDITDKIANYPNLKANISPLQFTDCSFLNDGRIYGVPRPNTNNKWGYIINKKWLDKLGLQPPKTVAEFVEVCRAFTFKDPDGNGRDDTYGVSLNGNRSIWGEINDFFSVAYNISNNTRNAPDADGAYRIRPLKLEYPAYLQQMRAMYQEGILDREFITHTTAARESHEKFAQGRVGIVGAATKNYIPNVLIQYNMDLDDYIFCPPLSLDSSKQPLFVRQPSCWMAYYIKKAASPEKQDAVLRVLDWGNSEKGFIAMQFGIQGEHYSAYDINNRTVTRSSAQYEAFRKATSDNFAFANAFQALPPLNGGAATPAQFTKWQAEAGVAEKITVSCLGPFTKILDQIGVQFPDISSNLTSLEVRYITGEATWEQLDTFIKNTYAPATSKIAMDFSDYMAKNPVNFILGAP